MVKAIIPFAFAVAIGAMIFVVKMTMAAAAALTAALPH